MLSLGKRSVELLLLKLSIPVCARVKRAFAGWGLPQSEHVCSGIPHTAAACPIQGMEWWDSSEPCRNMDWHDKGTLPACACALVEVVCPDSVPAGGGPPLGQPREGKWSGVWDRWGGWTSAPATGSCAAGLRPGPQQHPPAWRRGILATKNFFCLLRGALARRVDQRTLVAPDELPHTSLIS